MHRVTRGVWYTRTGTRIRMGKIHSIMDGTVAAWSLWILTHKSVPLRFDSRFFNCPAGGFKQLLMITDVPHEQDVKEWELRNNITIPTSQTTYWCTLFKASIVDTKHHVIGVIKRCLPPLHSSFPHCPLPSSSRIWQYSSQVTEGNEQFVHHLMVSFLQGEREQSETLRAVPAGPIPWCLVPLPRSGPPHRELPGPPHGLGSRWNGDASHTHSVRFASVLTSIRHSIDWAYIVDRPQIAHRGRVPSTTSTSARW